MAPFWTEQKSKFPTSKSCRAEVKPEFFWWLFDMCLVQTSISITGIIRKVQLLSNSCVAPSLTPLEIFTGIYGIPSQSALLQTDQDQLLETFPPWVPPKANSPFYLFFPCFFPFFSQVSDIIFFSSQSIYTFLILTKSSITSEQFRWNHKPKRPLKWLEVYEVMSVKSYILYGLYPLLLWQVKIQSVNLISVFINRRF